MRFCARRAHMCAHRYAHAQKIYIHAHEGAHCYTQKRTSTHTHTNTHMHVYVYARTSVRAQMHTCMLACTNAHAWAHAAKNKLITLPVRGLFPVWRPLRFAGEWVAFALLQVVHQLFAGSVRGAPLAAFRPLAAAVAPLLAPDAHRCCRACCHFPSPGSTAFPVLEQLVRLVA